MNLTTRPRRLRSSALLRSMVRETRISPDTLIYPIFFQEGENIREEIPSMPGQFRWSLDRADEILQQVVDSGVKSVLLFGIPAQKDAVGSGAWQPDGIVQKAVRLIKEKFPQLYVITDVCMCEYTSHGHCGILCGHEVDNDKTLEVLAKTALSHVQAGADMVRETRISPDTLIYPIFFQEGENIREEIPSMPGQFRWSLDRADEILQQVVDSGVKSVLLFGIPAQKDAVGSGAWQPDGIVQKAVRLIKEKFPQLYVITDVCMCEYTSHGHCGILCGHEVDNDKTLEVLAKTALSHVQAGADMVAPSDMMDGRVGRIRQVLDENGFTQIPIMAYSVKYASAFYGPFRDAAGSAPAFGDRKSYQMDPHNAEEALLEAQLDVQEGADILMVKPGMAYLDVLKSLKEQFHQPVALYSVSGEYAMIQAAAAAGYIDREAVICESAVCMYRAGADLLITYFAMELAKYIREGRIG